jgi:tetratricopeptide (TPR) repeat protein
MLHKLHNVKKRSVKAGFLSILILNISAIIGAPMTEAQAQEQAQAADALLKDGTISGTVLLKAGNRPASRVAVKLISRVAGIFRSVLTDLEGHFEVRSLPPSTYEIVVDEPGYQPTQTSTQFDGSSTKLMLYLEPSNVPQTRRNSYAVSTRELKIPDSARNEFEKGLGRLAKKDLGESLSHFAKATQKYPDYYEAFYHMGVAETRLGHLDEAKQAFQKAIDLSGGRYGWAEFGFGYVLYREGKPEEAVTVIRRGLETDESSADAYLILGMAQLRLNQVDEAERSAREVLLRNPKLAQAYLVLADSYGRRHDYQQQLQALNAYLSLEPNGPESEPVRQAREVVLGIVARLHLEN